MSNGGTRQQFDAVWDAINKGIADPAWRDAALNEVYYGRIRPGFSLDGETYGETTDDPNDVRGDRNIFLNAWTMPDLFKYGDYTILGFLIVHELYHLKETYRGYPNSPAQERKGNCEARLAVGKHTPLWVAFHCR